MHPDFTAIAKVLTGRPTVAVVGAKDRLDSPVDRVGRYLLEAGCTVIPVHPVRREVWGRPAYPTLLDIPLPLDIVDLFRAAEHCPAHAREVLVLPTPPRIFWMQSGIASPEARAILTATSILVVEDRCLMVEHRAVAGA